jgi:hypothetical protein
LLARPNPEEAPKPRWRHPRLAPTDARAMQALVAAGLLLVLAGAVLVLAVLVR